MIQFPPLPSWDGLHPLIVHFPIALLLVAPLFVLIGALLKPAKAGPSLLSALALMALGTAALFVAVETGEAAAQLAERNPQISAVLEQHQHLAERARVAFAMLTVVLAVIVLLPRMLRRPPSRVVTSVLPLVFLVLHGAGSLLLVNAAHNGGRLVHELGVRALVAPSADPTPTTGEARERE